MNTKTSASHQLIGLCVLLLFSSCGRNEIPTARSQFFRNNTEKKAHYVDFFETSLEMRERHATESYLVGATALGVMRDSLRDGRTLEEAYESARKGLRAAKDYSLETMNLIKQDFDPQRDTLFFYTYKNGRVGEQGWAVVRQGEIRKKYPLTAFQTDLTPE
jgi:hypothetical protein